MRPVPVVFLLMALADQLSAASTYVAALKFKGVLYVAAVLCSANQVAAS